MSKSRGNVIVPDPIIEEYGADTFRLYLMFMGPFQEGGDWRDEGIQ
ncbi:MAG: class I tRNA ligase family protein, partial [Gemmatimonadetes bacterium]|nr:class I tRNA ligase family protein [Gemmatimonadota bacterium]NIR79599.1 class I tRNA ligase family protein [Gemmatimonadota bacterium]NIT86096.1 class I tRNA ligase family protein [Gemmatimonadota bacterium]NIU32094.1 class I tRNA ligase family protein [Gemmatimonadota bacterium]NIU36689.1 class I tRNA ligase family protein [Gemmatimonadota bacterium]